MANSYLALPEPYCLSEPLQYYDVLPDHINYQLQDPDFQAPSTYCQYSPMQYSPMLQSGPSQPQYAHYSMDSQYSEAQYILGTCELSTPPCMVVTSGEDGYISVKRPRLSHSSIRVKGQDELCVVCGDKASGYHYNALTCEGCKGFFRRSITKNAVYRCKNGGHCEMDMYMRRKCQECRLKKCRAMGMLAECLLTEVQCKSKRLRKNTKQSSGLFYSTKMEDDHDSKHVSSTTKSGKALHRLELTTEERKLIDHIVAAHQKYAIPVNDAKTFLEETANPEESFFQMSETAVLHVQVLVEFTKRLPGFETLDHEDQIALLKGSTVEAMFLRSAQLYNQKAKDYQPSTHQVQERFLGHLDCSHIPDFEKCSLFSSEVFHRDGSPASTNSTDIMEEFITPLFNFYRSMGDLNVTETEYALLAATTVFFSDRPFLKNKVHVEKLQEPLLGILHKYSKVYHPEDPQHFARLIGRLTELRTLNHNHSEVLISWKVKDPKMTSLICDLWDLQRAT